MSSRRLIERYILRAVVPYAVGALFLLTGILLVQQSGRYFDTIFRGTVPAGFMFSLTLALLPTVLIFTIPMAVLSGTIIGFGRMGSDSELVAMRAAGVSGLKILAPALLMGILATLACLQLNLNEAPQAQQQLRLVGVRSALYKLDSPVEPQTFTTEIPGYVIYVREGDKTRGQWGGVFLRSQESDRSIRLVTAESGRIDSSADKSELVLQNAIQTRIPPDDATNQQYVVERLAQFRIVFDTGRSELLSRMQSPETKTDEMDFRRLRAFINQTTGVERREAILLLNKRLGLSFAPFIFSFFGAIVALRMRRGSRGFGVLISLLVMLIYYLLTIAGEQLARAGSLSPIAGGWLATSVTVLVGLGLWFTSRRTMRRWFTGMSQASEPIAGEPSAESDRTSRAMRSIRFPMLLDVSVLRTMIVSFLFGFIALVILFDIFTTFELWRFVVSKGAGTKILAQYLFYLLPLVSVELFPGSVLVATLITYALIAKKREAVAWWASGQSVYRLMLPGLVFAVAIAVGSWFIQERIMPQANIKQDSLRARIRGSVAQAASSAERRWLVSSDVRRIFSYDFDAKRQTLIKPTVYEFDSSRTALKRVIEGEEGNWTTGTQLEIKRADWIDLDQPRVTRQTAERLAIDSIDPPSVFKPTVDRPSQLNAIQLRDYIQALKIRGADISTLAVGLQMKYASPFAVVMMALIGMPLAISFGRKSTVLALCSAVVVSLSFWLLASGFTQLGEHLLLPPAVAAWAPIVIFSGGAFYFISRVRT